MSNWYDRFEFWIHSHTNIVHDRMAYIIEIDFYWFLVANSKLYDKKYGKFHAFTKFPCASINFDHFGLFMLRFMHGCLEFECKILTIIFQSAIFE